MQILLLICTRLCEIPLTFYNIKKMSESQIIIHYKLISHEEVPYYFLFLQNKQNSTGLLMCFLDF